MKAPVVHRKCLALISVLLVLGTQGISYGQAPTLAASPSPLWESWLNGAVVTLTLTDGSYERADIRDFVTVAGIAGVTVDSFFGIKRASSTEVTVELQFSGHLATDGTLTFTVQAQAIANYDGAALTAELPVSAGLGPFSRDPDKDFNTLGAAGNTYPWGLWSDGITMWVADHSDDKLYAYNLSTKARDPDKDFNTLGDGSSANWSDGITMWVADDWDEKIYAYDMATRAHDPGKDFNTLSAAGNDRPSGLWSDGVTMWVADDWDEKIYAYDMATRAHDPGKDFNTLRAAGNNGPYGLWSDGVTMWVADYRDKKLYAYDMATRAHDPGKDFNTLRAAGNEEPVGIWSDGITMWVADHWDEKLYAYKMPSGSLAGAGEPEDTAADLVVQSPAVSNSSPDAGTAFTFSATVRNQGSGQSPATTLRFYRSPDAVISTSDTEAGSHPVSGLAASGSSDHSIDLIAPSSFGLYYYGACVESVSEEYITGNNCSAAVAVVLGRDPDKDFNTGRDPDKDFNTLSAAGNNSPSGIWSDGITMWVADSGDDKIYAYDMATQDRDPARDFNTLYAAGNNDPDFLWSDGITMWVLDFEDGKIYAYDLATRARDPGRDFNTLSAAGNNYPTGIWSDGVTMWVADFARKIYAYDMATRARDPGRDFNTLRTAGNNTPLGLWSDGITMWVVSYDVYGKIDETIYAYDMATKAHDPDKDFNTLSAAGNSWPLGIWSDGITMWVADFEDGKLYAYKMPSGSLAGAGEPEDTAAPDLVVQSPAVSNSSPDAGTAFTFSATVRNQGTTQSPSTTLRFYRSTDATVSTSDTEVGSNAVGALAAAGTGAESIDLTAPSSAGTYYYGACVESVSGESDSQNNCSSAVAVTVAAAPETPAAAEVDFNGDGTVDFADFFEFVDAFGGSDPRFDLNGDGSVDFADFFEFVDAFAQPGQAKLVAMAQDMIGLPAGPQLQQNAPNPFNSETVISWFLLQPGPARLEVFALTGQRQAVLHRGPLQAGRHRLHWDGRDDAGRPLASGVYLYRLVSAESVLTRKLTLLR